VTENLINMLPELMAVRKSGLTFAPETASEELRKIQKKNIENEELFQVIRKAYKNGWERIKLYFMIGLPGETDEDVENIISFVKEVSNLRKEVDNRPGKVNLSISPFVPKPFSPFQREAMNDRNTIQAKVEKITGGIRQKNIQYRYPDTDVAILEGVFSRGDRRLADVIETAWRKGARFDRWDETFDFAVWAEAFQSHEIDPRFYTVRTRGVDEILPWSHIKTGCEEYVEKEYVHFISESKERSTRNAQKSKAE
jgi:radical SAM superfamily enzyme YgiQ (UPF0313 family)